MISATDCFFSRVRDSSLIENAFNVNPLYLKHENQDKILDYRVIEIELWILCFFSTSALALANSTWPTISFTENVVRISKLRSEWSSATHSKGKLEVNPDHSVLTHLLLQQVSQARLFGHLLEVDSRFELCDEIRLGLVCFRLKVRERDTTNRISFTSLNSCPGLE